MTTSTEAPVKTVSKSETGHYKNLANFSALIESVKNYGPQYNPSNANLGTANLESLRDRMEAVMSAVANAEIAHRNTVRERQEAYEGMSALATRIQNAFASCATKNEAANAKSYTHKIRGGGKKKASEETDEKSKSTSQMSFDNRMKNLKDFCAFLDTIPAYKPNEAALQPASISTYVDSLHSFNDAVNKTWNELDIARTERDRLMYNEDTGAIDIAYTVKSYVKSLFGTKSDEYARISGLRFVKI